MTRTFVLGGARSGKSSYAESLAIASNKEVIYIATAEVNANDVEMQHRIEHHQQRRQSDWLLVEEPIALARALQTWCTPERLVLVDCLTLWLTNLLFSAKLTYPDIGVIPLPALYCEQREQFLTTLDQVKSDLIIVSNETGLGVVPYGAVSRCFVDEAGRLNQDVAKRCERVVLVTAGLPLIIKGNS